MITVQIGAIAFKEGELAEGQLTQLIQRHHADGRPVCVRVRVNTDYASVALATGGCPPGGGGGGYREPNAQEQRIIDLWKRMGLDQAEFAPGKLIAFLAKVS